MKEYSIFDIVGPIMIGPSSSHTAGAARIGKVAKAIAGGKIKKAVFMLHGSFAKTYKGHGTDRALVAGILGLEPWDERLKSSFELAKQSGLEYEFIETDLGDVHPNTVKIMAYLADGAVTEIMGSSIGGGNILISEVDGEKVEFTGDYTTLIINHKDVPGMISKVSGVISNADINIAFLRVYRLSKGMVATSVFQTDTDIPSETVKAIKKVENVISVRLIVPVKEGE